jgi:integrase/recombinase XerD
MFWRDGLLYAQKQVKGKRQKRCLGTDDPASARTRREEWLKELEIDAGHAGGPLLFATVLADWKAFMTGKVDDKKWHGEVGERTLDGYRRLIAGMDKWLEGRKLSEVNKALIAEIIKARKPEVTTATIKRGLVALSSVMEYAIAHDFCDANPVLPWLKRLKERRDPIVEPRNQDIELLIQRSRGMWPYIIKAALVTGIREEALITAKRDFVDHELKQITVIDKGNKRRTVDLKPMGGYEIFKSIPAFASKPWLFWRTENKRVRKDSKRAPTFIGDRIEDPAPEFKREVARVTEWAEQNGVEFHPFTFHALRHKHAIEYLRHGGNIYDLQKRLGHASLAQTEAYLQFLTPEQQRGATHGEGVLKRRFTLIA